jgi:hypothetical protein
MGQLIDAMRLVQERCSKVPVAASEDRTMKVVMPLSKGSNDPIEKMERETGIEPVTSSLGSWRSTAELLPLGKTKLYRAQPEILRFAQDFGRRLPLCSRLLKRLKLAFYR